MIAALSFLTVFGRGRTPAPVALWWFAPTGAAVGGVVGLAWWGTAEVFDPFLAALVAVAVDLAITGLLHADGLADASDGLLPPMESSRRLAIMRAPGVGAFALAVVPTVIVIRGAALASQDVEPLLVVGLWALSRAFAASAVAWTPYARNEGLVTAFSGPGRRAVAVTVLPAVVLVVVARPWEGLAIAAAALIAALAVLALGMRRLGGHTGDVLGALIVLAETAGLVTGAARW